MDLKEEGLINIDLIDHWYYQSKSAALAKLIEGYQLPRIVTDVGAGSGFFSKHLIREKLAAEATCVDINYTHENTTSYCGVNIHYRKKIDTTSANLFLLMDVLEHVDDDFGLLSYYVNLANDDSIFFISVPAYQFLWSNHDIFLEHKRRYSMKQIKNLVERTDLVIEKCCYFYGFIFPIILLVRMFTKFFNASKKPTSNLSLSPPFANFILKKICLSEILFCKFNSLFGSTILCVARKISKK